MVKTRTDLVRQKIHDYLESKGEGTEVRQKDLIEYLQSGSLGVSIGVIRGVLYKMNNAKGWPNDSGTIEIRDVETIKKPDGSVYYAYHKHNTDFPEGTIMAKLKAQVFDFSKRLSDQGLLDESFLDVPFGQRRSYTDFLVQFEKLRDMFLPAE